VKTPALADAKKIVEYKPPKELLSATRFSRVNQGCAGVSQFVLAWTEVCPLTRLLRLRGTDAALADLAAGTKAIRGLLSTLHDFYCREMQMWAETDVDGVVFMDDLGSPDKLLIDRAVWRDLFRPLYREYCDILHAKDKFAFFHCNGDISSIFGDVVKTGIDAIHAQLFLMSFERLAKRYRGRVTFWGEIDQQQALPFGAPEDVREAVLRVRKALDFGSGGVIAQCQWEPNVPLRNIATLFEQWMAPLPMHV
jgi:hypothetical protein